MHCTREQCVTKGNQPFIFIKDPMLPTGGDLTESAAAAALKLIHFGIIFVCVCAAGKSQEETKEIIILVNQYKNG